MATDVEAFLTHTHTKRHKSQRLFNIIVVRVFSMLHCVCVCKSKRLFNSIVVRVFSMLHCVCVCVCVCVFVKAFVLSKMTGFFFNLVLWHEALKDSASLQTFIPVFVRPGKKESKVAECI
jgi:hypothetical protein